MKNHKYVYIKFHVYEYKRIESYLEDMSSKGWMITGRIAGFGSVLCFKRIAEKRHKFHVLCNPQATKLWGSFNLDKHQGYIEFMETYGYAYVCGDPTLLIFRNEDVNAMELMEQSEETNEEIKKYTLWNDIFSPIYSCFILLPITYMFLSDAQWMNLDVNQAVFITIITMSLIVNIITSIEAFRYRLTKCIPDFQTIRIRSRCMVALYTVLELFVFALYYVQKPIIAGVFLGIELLIVLFLTWLLRKEKMQFQVLRVLYSFMVGACVFLFYSPMSQERLDSSFIPFRVQDLFGVEKNCNKEVIDIDRHFFANEYIISQYYYDAQEGGRHSEAYTFDYRVYVVKHDFVKDAYIQNFMKETHVSYSTEFKGIKVYTSDWLQLLVKDDTILLLNSDVPINNNRKQFEKAFTHL